MDNSWVKTYRSIAKCQTASRGFEYVGAMTLLVVCANYEDGWDKTVKVPRGSLFVTVTELMEQWHCSKQTVRTVLKNLKADGFITLKSNTSGTLVTICNYNRYQSQGEIANTSLTLRQHIANTSSTHALINSIENKERKNIKECEKKNASARTCEESVLETERKYPESVDEILAIAKSSAVGMPCTQEQAEEYFLNRVQLWTDAAGRKIEPARVPYDIKKWLIRKRNEKNEREAREKKKGDYYSNGKHLPTDPSEYTRNDEF